ncbi:MAG: TatD family hydrolase, partial [bacterium]|nr:TatD family hydrolase [bacterium]
MIDTHIHLSSIDYYNNPDQVLGLLEENGVSSIVNVATDIETSKQSIKLSQKFPKLSYATVGIHPEEINSDTDTQVLKQLEQLVQQKTVVAVGEVGLDKTYIQKLGESEMTERFNWQNNW